MTRKIIQIALGNADGLWALCDDGSLWTMIEGGAAWAECPTIPPVDHAFDEVEPVRAPWHPIATSHEVMWCIDAADESVTEVPGPIQFVRWSERTGQHGEAWTMVLAFSDYQAKQIWHDRLRSGEVETRTLTIGGREYPYIESALPF